MLINIDKAEDNAEKQRVIDDILTVYYSDRFTNVKNNTLRVIDLLYKMGYYKNSESLFVDKDNL